MFTCDCRESMMRYVRGLIFCLALVTAAGVNAKEPSTKETSTKVTYDNPPKRVLWIEGENAFQSNWVPGESRHCWWYKYADVTGRGILEVASPTLPASGFYDASWKLPIPNAGTYGIYVRCRVPGYVASPFEWRINGASWKQTLKTGVNPLNNPDMVAETLNYKMGLIRLGVLELPKGDAQLDIRVDKYAHDKGKYISQAIDAILVSKLKRIPPSTGIDIVPATKKKDVADATITVDPAKAHFHVIPIKIEHHDWSKFRELALGIRVTRQKPTVGSFVAHLRLYSSGKFVDLPVNIAPKDYSKSQIIKFNLDKTLKPLASRNIDSAVLMVSDKWFVKPATYDVRIESLRLIDVAPAFKHDIFAKPPVGAPAPVAMVQPLGTFVWNESTESGDVLLHTAPQPDPDKLVRAVAGHLSLDIGTGGAIGNIAFDHSSMSQGVPAGLISIDFLNNTRWTSAGKGEVRVVKSGYELRAADDKAAVVLRYQLAGNSIRITADITNKSKAPIWQVSVIPLNNVSLGGDSSDDVYLLGNRRIPFGSLPAKGLAVSPRNFPFDFVNISDGKTALSLRLEDREMLDSRVTYGRDGSTGYVILTKFPEIDPGKTWTFPAIVVSADDSGTWYEGADAYRRWFESWAKAPKFPEWFKSVGGVVVGISVLKPGAIQANRKRIATVRALTGLDWFHTGKWLPRGTEAWYPLGYHLTKSQLQLETKVVRDIHEQGAHVSFYTNPLLFSMVIPAYAEYGRSITAIAKDGFPYYSEHTTRHHPMAIPMPTVKWATHFVEDIRPIVKAVKIDALYMDQFGAVPTHLDFAAKRHGFPAYGYWRESQAKFTRFVVNELHKDRPTLATFIEGPNIAAQQFIDMALLVPGDEKVLHYVFPRELNAVGKYTPDIPEKQMMDFARTAFTTGQPLIIFSQAVASMSKASQQLFRRIVATKRALDPMLFEGQYRDVNGLTVDGDAVASLFKMPDGLAIPFISGEHAAKISILSPLSRSPKVVLMTSAAPHGIEMPTHSGPGGTLMLEVPADTVGIVRIQ